jgi:hypothetical protein
VSEKSIASKKKKRRPKRRKRKQKNLPSPLPPSLSPSYLVVEVAAAQHVLAVVKDLLEGGSPRLARHASERDGRLGVGGLRAVLNTKDLDVGLGDGAELLGDLLDDGGLVLLELADLVVEDDGHCSGFGFGGGGQSQRAKSGDGCQRAGGVAAAIFAPPPFRKITKNNSPLTRSSAGLGLAVAAAPTAVCVRVRGGRGGK